MWIARDKDGELWLYSVKPTLGKHSNGNWICKTLYDLDKGTYGKITHKIAQTIDSNFFPEVTFENSPKELVIK